jgi:hypothetical protein
VGRRSLRSDSGSPRTFLAAVQYRYRAQHPPAITEDDTKVFQVLISEVLKNGKIDAVLGKALRVLGHAELFEPGCNLLHREGTPTEFTCDQR